MAEDRHGDDLVAALELEAAYAGRLAAFEHAHIDDGKRIALPSARQQHVVVLAAHIDPDDAVAGIEPHGDLAVLAHFDEIGELVPSHAAVVRGEHHVELLPRGFVLGQRQDGGDGLVLVERQEIDERLAAGLGCATGKRHTVIL